MGQIVVKYLIAFMRRPNPNTFLSTRLLPMTKTYLLSEAQVLRKFALSL